jgi:carbonic anhydrase/acetyltransferase-like protein (isoleucine patch superfamily)
MGIRVYEGIRPQVADGCYLDETAVVIGDVVLEKNVSVWPYAVIRGDVNSMRIGEGSNIQDFAMLHVTHKRPADPEGAPLVIGRHVTIAHHVNLHGCTIGDEVLVGIGSIVMDRVVIEPKVMVGAGSLVPPGKRLASGWLYVGNPVKQVRLLTESELAWFKYSAEHYMRLALKHAASREG